MNHASVLKSYLLVALSCFMASGAGAGEYAIVVSEDTLADKGWKAVVGALEAKYPAAERIVYSGNVTSARDQLAAVHPRHTCFVTTPDEAGRQFVADVHLVTRQLDEDPYTDTIWGILTGADAANGLAIAKRKEPLTIRRAAAGTEFALDMVDQGKWYCELNPGKMVEKRDGTISQVPVSPDTTAALVDSLSDYRPDLFITSGHATERDWQIGFSYRNGQFRSKAGMMYGQDLGKNRIPIVSDNPKVYMAVGNCLMGHIDGPDAMALAWMKSVGVHQMIGYTVNTWYGYGGWGCLDYFVEQPGRYTFSEAFLANHHALLHRLGTAFSNGADAPGEAVVGKSPRYRFRPIPTEEARRLKLTERDGYGLRYDRDVVAFYGDPGWSVRMKARPLHWKQSLVKDGDLYTFVIEPQSGARSFESVNSNGAQRGGRPVIELLSERIEEIEIKEGAQYRPVIADDFILVPHPGAAMTEPIRIVFRAKKQV